MVCLSVPSLPDRIYPIQLFELRFLADCRMLRKLMVPPRAASCYPASTCLEATAQTPSGSHPLHAEGSSVPDHECSQELPRQVPRASGERASRTEILLPACWFPRLVKDSLSVVEQMSPKAPHTRCPISRHPGYIGYVPEVSLLVRWCPLPECNASEERRNPHTALPAVLEEHLRGGFPPAFRRSKLREGLCGEMNQA